MKALRKRIHGTRPVSENVSAAFEWLGEIVWAARYDIVAAIVFEIVMAGLRRAGAAAMGGVARGVPIAGGGKVIPFPGGRRA